MFNVKSTWDELKQFSSDRYAPLQYWETANLYYVAAKDDFFFAQTVIKKGTADATDFEANYKTDANVRLQDRDKSGRKVSRMAATERGWQFHLTGIEFTTAKIDSLYHKDPDGNDLNQATVKFYDDQDVEVTEQVNEVTIVKTVLDFEPPFDIELIGGKLKQLNTTAQDVRVYVIAVPDVPKAYGGSKDFVCCINMKFIRDHDSVDADGRSSKLLKFDAVNHTNKVQLIVNHPAGFQHDMMMLLEMFKE